MIGARRILGTRLAVEYWSPSRGFEYERLGMHMDRRRESFLGKGLQIRPPRKKSADLGSSRCEVDIKRVYDAVIRPGNLSNAGLILPTCRSFRLSLLSDKNRQTWAVLAARLT